MDWEDIHYHLWCYWMFMNVQWGSYLIYLYPKLNKCKIPRIVNIIVRFANLNSSHGGRVWWILCTILYLLETLVLNHTPGMLHLVFNHSWLVFLLITYYKYPFLKCAVRPHDHELCQHLIDTMEMWWVGVMSVECLQLYWKVKVKQAPLSMGFFRQEYWSGFLFLSPGDLLDQGSNPGLPNYKQILYHLRHQGLNTVSRYFLT